MTLAASISDLKDLLTAITAGVVAIIALAGYGEWRRQIVGKSRYEVSVRLLRAIYELEAAVTAFRQPFISDFEYPTSTIQIDPEVYARINRSKSLNKPLASFNSARFEARAVIGKSALDSVDKLRTHFNTLFSSLWMYTNLHRTAAPGKETLIDKHHRVIADYDTEDKFRPELDSLIKTVESDIGPFIK